MCLLNFTALYFLRCIVENFGCTLYIRTPPLNDLPTIVHYSGKVWTFSNSAPGFFLFPFQLYSWQCIPLIWSRYSLYGTKNFILAVARRPNQPPSSSSSRCCCCCSLNKDMKKVCQKRSQKRSPKSGAVIKISHYIRDRRAL